MAAPAAGAPLAWAAEPVELGREDDLVVVLEREWGVAGAGHGGWIVSDFATTCVVVALRCRATGTTCVAHIASAEEAPPVLARMVEKLGEDVSRVDAAFLGSYAADAADGEASAADAVAGFLAAARIPVKGSQTGGANTDGGGRPISRGLAVRLSTGEARPAALAPSVAVEDLPCGPFRCARSLYARKPGSACWPCIRADGPRFAPGTLRAAADPASLRRLLSWDDATLLRRCSTSPDAEDAGFCHRLRLAARFALDHPSLELGERGPAQ